ncbi:MAG: sigma-70 family RNA polymerase sigma factor [Gammaproteobacteria bacterium]|jgi:RNA polymerase sigma-70 factor (ECF subfamily)|nr:MAG: sigma-70 family RNA polymerase sigma factor [Gammaproteobacteria bacterium]
MSTKISDLGRRREFDDLVRELRPDLYRYAFWLSRSRQVADDVVQEALLRAWKAFDRLRDSSAAKQWLVSIVRREHARLYERKRLETVDLTAYEEELPAPGTDPDLEKLRIAIFELEDGYREPLALQVLMGHTTREIAELMNIKEGAVLTRLHRARKRLKADLGRETDEPRDDEA